MSRGIEYVDDLRLNDVLLRSILLVVVARLTIFDERTRIRHYTMNVAHQKMLRQTSHVSHQEFICDLKLVHATYAV